MFAFPIHKADSNLVSKEDCLVKETDKNEELEMSLSSIASLDDKWEMVINQAMIMCFICKKIGKKEKDEIETPKNQKFNEIAKQKHNSSHHIHHYEIQVKLDQSSDFLRTRPVI